MLDEEGDGKLDYVDLVHSYLSEMNDLGKSLVIKVGTHVISIISVLIK